jgi:alkanesulfonate monooxygenase SsuD/methylene tetrahydromethanopterin reductase-like flavin-dependent oxidoreductase (luciferase family)
MAGDRGLGVLSFNFNWEQVQKSMETHRKACEHRSDLVPKVPNDQFAAVALCTVCENKEEETVGLAGARWFFQNVAKLFEPLMAKNKLYSYEYLRNLFAMELNPADATDAQLKNHDMIVVGDPDYVVRKLEQFQRAGVSQVIFFKQSGRIPHQTIMRSLRLIGKHALPHFNPHRTIASEETALAAAGG